MKSHQLLRVAGIAGIVAAYIARLAIIGNGPIKIFGYQMAMLGMVGIVILILAAPETLDQLPLGPTRKN